MRNDRFVERKLVRVELLDRGIIPAFHFAEGGYHSTEVEQNGLSISSRGSRTNGSRRAKIARIFLGQTAPMNEKP